MNMNQTQKSARSPENIKGLRAAASRSQTSSTPRVKVSSERQSPCTWYRSKQTQGIAMHARVFNIN